ncbi:phage tail assembly protein [Novosphingobium pituita]|uniref:Phage tail assembly protein n=1 Tax=Novosphingobium pituita TaxID=3056842 RepID=A0ABQ6P4W2_9SPHN|nr:phage tail assembly protein [Novosphingobium sp. IK01]GMM59900.1 hypothetical protein NUTIK01_06770 [Novosphingobium sp. IK01]
MTELTPASPATVTIAFGQPIVRDGGPVESVIVRKPKGGDLRGAKLTELMAADVDAVARVIPRITTPAILPHEFYALEADDLAEVVGTVVGFFLNKAQREAMASMAGGMAGEMSGA